MMRYLCMMTLILAVGIFVVRAASTETQQKPETVMYVFAHQDDEADVIGKIAADLAKSREVYCVWVTAGDRGGPSDVRKQETIGVTDTLKVPRDHLTFLGYPDQFAYKHLKEIAADLTKISETLHPVEIMSHAYEGGNIDHDAVAMTSDFAAKKVGAVHLEFPDNNIYNGRTQIWKFLPRDNAPTLYTPLDKKMYDMKMNIAKMYPSQMTSMSSYVLSCDKKSFKNQGEPYRVAPEYDFTKMPAAELRYFATSKGLATFDDWKNAAEEFLAGMKEK